MKKLILFAVAILFIVTKTEAAEPIVTVPPLESGTTYDLFESDDELMNNMVLKYYELAVMLKAQLMYYGVAPVIDFETPLMEDSDGVMIKKYHEIALQLSDQIQGLTETEYKQELLKFKQEAEKLRKQLFTEQLKNANLDFYREESDNLSAENERLSFVVDSLSLEFHKKLQAFKEMMRKHAENYNKQSLTILSFALGGYQYYTGDERLTSKVSMGGMLTLNAGQFFGFGKYFDIWGEYNAPKLRTKLVLEYPELEDETVYEELKAHMFSLGVAGNIPEIFKIADFYGGLKLGAGYFWGNAFPYNSDAAKTVWEGPVARAEFNLSSFNRYFPMELYVAWYYYSFSKELEFNQSSHSEVINLGNASFTSLSLGIRFAVWRAAHY